MPLVEHLTGSGPVTRDGETLLPSVRFILAVVQEQVSDGHGGVVDGHLRVDGQLAVDDMQAHLLMQPSDSPCTLTLKDGRTLNFYMVNNHGTIAPADGGTLCP